MEQGHDINVVCWVGFLAPKGIEEAKQQILVDALKNVFAGDAYIEFCKGRGCDSTYYTPDEFLAMAEADYTYYSELISDLKIGQ